MGKSNRRKKRPIYKKKSKPRKNFFKEKEEEDKVEILREWYIGVDSERDSKLHIKEQKLPFTQELFKAVKKCDDILETSCFQKNGGNDEEISKEDFHLAKEEQNEASNNENISITFWRNRKIYINAHLIPLRIALFLWFASGSVSLPFFPLLLTHRGLKLSDFHFAFSMLFLFQLMVAYVCGIIADKLGNAKRVLLCLMIFSIFSLLGVLVLPDIKGKFCLEEDTYASCIRDFNCSSYLEICKHDFYTDNTKNFAVEKNKSSCNASFLSSEDIFNHNSSEILEDALYLNDTVLFCNEMCSRFDLAAKNCHPGSQKGYKMIYLVLILSYFSVWSTVFRFADFAALKLAEKHNSSFGKELLFGFVGHFIASLWYNFVLNKNELNTVVYFDNVYWFVLLLQVLSFLSVCKMERVISLPGIELGRKTLMLFSDVELMSMIIIAFAVGIGYGFDCYFNFFFLDSLKAPKIIIGLNAMTYSFYSFPIVALSEWWLRKLEQKRIVVISLLSYTISATSYSFLYHPWLSLIIDVARAFYFHLFMLSVFTHCQKIAPEGFGATINAVIGTSYFAIGRSFSIHVGGHFVSRFGARTTYRIFAGFSFVSAILYSLFLSLRFCNSGRNRRNNKDPEETKTGENEV